MSSAMTFNPILHRLQSLSYKIKTVLFSSILLFKSSPLSPTHFTLIVYFLLHPFQVCVTLTISNSDNLQIQVFLGHGAHKQRLMWVHQKFVLCWGYLRCWKYYCSYFALRNFKSCENEPRRQVICKSHLSWVKLSNLSNRSVFTFLPPLLLATSCAINQKQQANHLCLGTSSNLWDKTWVLYSARMPCLDVLDQNI